MKSISSEKIIIVGGIPEPSGGVTNYIYRITQHLPDLVYLVLDLYPSKYKYELKETFIKTRPKSKALSWLWINLQLIKYNFIKNVFFNFSTAKSLLLLCFIPKFSRQRWLLILHHGNLSIRNGFMFKPINHLIKYGASRVDAIGYISDTQLDFYQSIGVPDARLKRVSTYLPYVQSEKYLKNLKLETMLQEIRSKYKKLVLTSGYPTLSYRYDWTVEYLSAEKNGHEYALIICVYGKEVDNVLSYLRQAAKNNKNIYLFEYLNMDEFQQVLKESDIYVRPSVVDSFGVAVAEAVEAGLTVIASDCCQRYPGAHLFEMNNKARYHDLMKLSLSGNINNNINKTQNVIMETRAYLCG